MRPHVVVLDLVDAKVDKSTLLYETHIQQVPIVALVGACLWADQVDRAQWGKKKDDAWFNLDVVGLAVGCACQLAIDKDSSLTSLLPCPVVVVVVVVASCVDKKKAPNSIRRAHGQMHAVKK